MIDKRQDWEFSIPSWAILLVLCCVLYVAGTVYRLGYQSKEMEQEIIELNSNKVEYITKLSADQHLDEMQRRIDGRMKRNEEMNDVMDRIDKKIEILLEELK